MKKRLLLVLIRTVLWRIAIVWCKTLKISKTNGEQFDDLRRSGKNYVIAFWHGSMFIGWFLHRPMNKQHVSALISQSSDGEFLATIVERWGYSLIRGSSHVGGKEAMALMVDAVGKGSSLAITPDGPRGPRHEMKMGAVRIAQKSKVPLVLAGFAMKNNTRLRSWDHFEVPIPFSSVAVTYSEPFMIPQELAGESLESYKMNLQERLNQLTVDAEQSLIQEGRRT